MKNTQLSRLFVNTSIIKGDKIRLTKNDSHYLIKVMRKKINDKFLIFNENYGEWLVAIKDYDKNNILIEVLEQIRSMINKGKIWLIFSLIKSARLPFLIEKATELGVEAFIPIITDHSVVDKMNYDKVSLWIKEAAEQCNRLTIPKLEKEITFNILMENWPSQNKIILCDETEKENTIFSIKDKFHAQDFIPIMIGPEGGFSKKEFEIMHNSSFITPIKLNDNILRAETASLVAINSVNLVLS